MVKREPANPLLILTNGIGALYCFNYGAVIGGIVMLIFAGWVIAEWLAPALSDLRVDHFGAFAAAVVVLMGVALVDLFAWS